MNNPTLNYRQFKHEFEARDWPFQTSPFALNVLGIRSNEPRAGYFDDTICIAWVDDAGIPYTFNVPATTDPGSYYLQKPMNPKGTAILAPGFYEKMYRPGQHRGRYRALIQVNPCTVIRDANRDAILDYEGPRETGLFGINLHRAAARGTTLTVGPHSAGCQVVQRAHDLAYILALVDSQMTYCDTAFVSYALLPEYDLLTYTLGSDDEKPMPIFREAIYVAS